MKYRIYFPSARGTPVAPITLEALAARVDGSGSLTLTGQAGSLIAAYAAGTWHTVIDVGAFAQAHAEANPPPPAPPKASRENTRRRQAPRESPAA